MGTRGVTSAVVLLLLVACVHVTALPAGFTELELLARLQLCFRLSGMSELEAAEVRRAADADGAAAAGAPSVTRRRHILQAFLDCCAGERSSPAQEADKQHALPTSADQPATQLRQLQRKIQRIYQKHLMGSSVGLHITA